jgi:hypothetical protein
MVPPITPQPNSGISPRPAALALSPITVWK